MTDFYPENDISRLEAEVEDLKRRLSEVEEGELEARKKIDDEYKAAQRLKNEAAQKYALELVALKNFSKKWRAALSSGADDKKSEMIDLLKGFLDEIGVDNAVGKLRKCDEILKADADKRQEENGQAFEFDLNEALNPSEELDLEELCKELGVYRG